MNFIEILGNGDRRGEVRAISSISRLRHRKIRRNRCRPRGLLNAIGLHRKGNRRSQKYLH
jgi:hypothetical protein